MLNIQPMGEHAGCLISGVDVKGLDDAGFAPIYQAWLRYGIIAVRGQARVNLFDATPGLTKGKLLRRDPLPRARNFRCQFYRAGCRCLSDQCERPGRAAEAQPSLAWIFAQVSRSPTVRWKAGAPGRERTM